MKSCQAFERMACDVQGGSLPGQDKGMILNVHPQGNCSVTYRQHGAAVKKSQVTAAASYTARVRGSHPLVRRLVPRISLARSFGSHLSPLRLLASSFI